MAGLPDAVEAVRRRGARGSYLVVLNHGAVPAVVTGPGHDLLGDRRVDDGALLPVGGHLVLREDPGAAASGAWSVAEG